MSYYIYNLAVRWQGVNGEIEGFSGKAPNAMAARARAIIKANKKAVEINSEFKIISSCGFRELTIDEQDSLQRDWDKKQNG